MNDFIEGDAADDLNSSEESEGEYYERIKSGKIKRRKSYQNLSHKNESSDETTDPDLKFKVNGLWWMAAVPLFILFITYSLTFFKNNIPDRLPHIKEIEVNYPGQSKILWKAIESGINTTINEEKPTTYIFLYTNEAEPVLNNLLEKLGWYASCHLSDCDYDPISFDRKNLPDDYGTLLAEYEMPLRYRGVMVVKNIDEIPAKHAQAFHNFCDEITPLVGKSVFFLTVKVNRFISDNYKKDSEQLEDILRKKWHGLDQDIFDPLYTRISGMILRINPV